MIESMIPEYHEQNLQSRYGTDGMEGMAYIWVTCTMQCGGTNNHFLLLPLSTHPPIRFLPCPCCWLDLNPVIHQVYMFLLDFDYSNHWYYNIGDMNHMNDNDKLHWRVLTGNNHSSRGYPESKSQRKERDASGIEIKIGVQGGTCRTSHAGAGWLTHTRHLLGAQAALNMRMDMWQWREVIICYHVISYDINHDPNIFLMCSFNQRT